MDNKFRPWTQFCERINWLLTFLSLIVCSMMGLGWKFCSDPLQIFSSNIFHILSISVASWASPLGSETNSVEEADMETMECNGLGRVQWLSKLLQHMYTGLPTWSQIISLVNILQNIYLTIVTVLIKRMIVKSRKTRKLGRNYQRNGKVIC